MTQGIKSEKMMKIKFDHGQIIKFHQNENNRTNQKQIEFHGISYRRKSGKIMKMEFYQKQIKFHGTTS